MNAIKEYKLIQTQITQKSMIAQQYLGYCNSLKHENKTMEQHIGAAKASITQMNHQLNSFAKKVTERRTSKYECGLCKNALNDVMVLPCNHLMGCAECIKSRFQVDLSSRRRQGVNVICVVCNQAVQDFIQIKFD